ncbi:unnamed protein product [Cuscuta campestris]|uniref:cyclin-dependent kinase n=1 Tax=Cuscuta campestris TaxID=132261 RepID=A0A484L2K3_9ASTE|nr:unnamed protein product [Cuscuta campestris]
MERYKIITEVGNGTFGRVWRALNTQTGEMVAIKRMKKKYYSWEECMNLREVKSLRRMNHPNIVKLKEVIRENDTLFFVFEYMECNLYELMKDRGKLFSETQVKKWCFQVFQGLAYMHQQGYFHRDLKPENLLVSKDVIKIADFGLAREVNSEPPYTEYVSTRWYRAPEVLLQSPTYGSAVDMWAMGAIMAEMFTLRPLFPGLNEADEIQKICNVMGTPTKTEWSDGLELANSVGYQFPKVVGVHLSVPIPSASEDAINLITSLCSWDPSKRPTAVEVLQHRFFESCFSVPPSIRTKACPPRAPNAVGRNTPGFATSGVKPTLEQKPKRWSSATIPSNSTPTGDLCAVKSHLPLSTGAQRKLEMNSQNPTKMVKPPADSMKQQQPKYRPPAMKVPTENARGWSNASPKYSNTSFGSARPALKQQQFPQPMKAGGWQGNPAMFPNSNDVLPGRTYPRKVAG